MKCAEYYVENHKIEIYDSFFGKEKVYLNGRKISESKSTLRRSHQFNIKDNAYTISPKMIPSSTNIKYFEVYKNGAPLTLVNFIDTNSRGIFVLVIVIGLIVGFIIGLYLYELLGKAWFDEVLDKFHSFLIEIKTVLNPL